MDLFVKFLLLVSCRFVRQSISMIAWEFVAKSNPCENFLVAESDFHENIFFFFLETSFAINPILLHHTWQKIICVIFMSTTDLKM
jgi:hypothetical protein